MYSQNPSELGDVAIDAAADVNITDVKLYAQRDKLDGRGKEYHLYASGRKDTDKTDDGRGKSSV